MSPSSVKMFNLTHELKEFSCEQILVSPDLLRISCDQALCKDDLLLVNLLIPCDPQQMNSFQANCHTEATVCISLKSLRF
jgi:hypothetical protein